jgi:hypothetical protein
VNEWRSRHDRKVRDTSWINLVQGAVIAAIFYIFVVIVFSVEI